MSNMAPRIPEMTQPASLLEHGPNGHNLAAQATARHPVDDLQRSAGGQQQQPNLAYVRAVYGSGLAMRLATEQKIAAQQEALAPPMMATNHTNLYREIVSGQDVQLGFEDFLSLPQHQPHYSNKDSSPHAWMERQLGM
jgi:hypothetical protein